MDVSFRLQRQFASPPESAASRAALRTAAGPPIMLMVRSASSRNDSGLIS
jgi:hypothetical protein